MGFVEGRKLTVSAMEPIAATVWNEERRTKNRALARCLQVAAISLIAGGWASVKAEGCPFPRWGPSRLPFGTKNQVRGTRALARTPDRGRMGFVEGRRFPVPAMEPIAATF